MADSAAATNPTPAAANPSGECVGIDLGTTMSCVAVYRNGTVEIIPNETGNRTTPSFVAFTEDERLMGEAAKNQAVTNAANTIYDAKRLIGRTRKDEGIERDIKNFPFAVVDDASGRLLIQVTWRGEKKTFAPEEISAMVLKKLKDDASTYLGSEVTEAVVTVPAYFNDLQRSQTKLAGSIAGLNVRRVINEPTAAAIAYGLDRKATAAGGLGGAAQTILIFDLGGGTFDVSLLQIQEGIFEVKATNGDTHLGGEDFDHSCLEFLSREFTRQTKLDFTTSARSVRRLLNAIEKAKRVLSSAASASVSVDSLFEGHDFEYTLTRAKFEELNAANFRRLLRPVEQVLTDAKMKKADVQEVVLVGGSTRIPKVQTMLQEFFSGKELNKSINPDEAVAYGAAVQGAILMGKGGSTCQDLLLLDVIPLSLGIETVGGVMAPVLKRNTAIPARKTKTFTTEADNQTDVDIDVYEGERPQTSGNNLLGKFVLQGLPPAKRGVPKILVTFDVDANGILNVHAQDEATGKSERITITSALRGTDDQVKEMLAKAAQYKQEDELVMKRVEAKHAFSEYLYQVKDAATQLGPQLLKMKLSDEVTSAVAAAEEALEWLEENTGADLAEIERKRREVTAIWQPLIGKSYN